MKRRRRLLLVSIAALGAAGAFAYFGTDARVRSARALSRSYSHELALGPAGWTARAPPDITCRSPTEPQPSAQCGSDRWRWAWRIEPESDTTPIPELIARARTRPSEENSYEELVATHAIGGYRGYLKYWMGTKRPANKWAFVGYQDVPGRGRFRLTVTAENESYALAVAESLEGLAVILTTTIEPPR